MKEDFSFLTNLIEMLKESTLLTERSRVETQINTTMLNLLYDITHFNKNDPNAEEKAKNIWDRIQKPINVSASNHAGYTWNGASIKTTKFLKSPRDVKVVQGDVETYRCSIVAIYGSKYVDKFHHKLAVDLGIFYA